MLDTLPFPIRRMVIGGLMAIAGLVLTGGGWLWAALHEGGGKYFLFWGLVFWGGIYIVQGASGLPAYFKAKNSGDPWRLAPYNLDLLYRLASESLNSQNPTERARSLYSLPVLTTRVSVNDLARAFALGLTDHVPDVQSAAYQSLLLLSKDNKGQGATVVRAMLEFFQRDRGLIPYVPGGPETLNKFHFITSDFRVFDSWTIKGELPELPATNPSGTN